MARRIDYYDDPDGPRANSMVPSVNVVVTSDNDEILLIRRSDNDNWAIPGGAIELGESMTQAAIRETKEESGIDCEITGLVGIYTDPKHVILYTSNGEARQEFSIVLTGTPGRGRAHLEQRVKRSALGACLRYRRLRYGSLHANPHRSLPGKAGFSGPYVMAQHGGRLHLSGQAPAGTAVARRGHGARPRPCPRGQSVAVNSASRGQSRREACHGERPEPSRVRASSRRHARLREPAGSVRSGAQNA